MNATSATILTLGTYDWHHYWPQAANLLAPALKLSGGRHTLQSTKEMLADGTYAMLVALVGSNVKSACICTVTQYPAARWLTIILCGGEDMLMWLEQGRFSLEKLAKLHECEGLEVIGRQGWQRAMDLQPIGLWMERRL